MAKINDKIAANAAGHLQPGEQVQAAFATQTKPWWMMLLGMVVFIVANRYRPVVVTDGRIIVFDGGRWATTAVKSVVREVPRSVRIGPAKGLWYTTNALGEPLHVHKRFHGEINRADAVLPAV